MKNDPNPRLLNFFDSEIGTPWICLNMGYCTPEMVYRHFPHQRHFDCDGLTD